MPEDLSPEAVALGLTQATMAAIPQEEASEQATRAARLYLAFLQLAQGWGKTPGPWEEALSPEAISSLKAAAAKPSRRGNLGI